ncbi:MAG: hypothetical protein LH610_06380 [Sphingomonas bacterium]|nr:hypothetical protein [Sphingomonas bacterium]
MNTPAYRRSSSWVATLAWVILLILVGAGLAAWGLSRWDTGARFLGVAPEPAVLALQPVRPAPQAVLAPGAGGVAAPDAAAADRLAMVEARLRNVENTAQRSAGSVGRADALLVAFASRRAIDRGVQLGYLETLLAERFGGQNPVAVATIITASRTPVTLDQLTNDYGALEGELRRGPPDEGLWQGLKREMGSIVAVRRASAPSPKPEARYERAMARLEQGQVDVALAETMRLPGASRAGPWIASARRYVAAHRALDEVESAALLTGGR